MRDGSILFHFLIGVGGQGEFWSEREKEGENFQGVCPLETVSAARAHILFGIGWVDRWGEGKVVFLGRGVCGNSGICWENIMSVA